MGIIMDVIANIFGFLVPYTGVKLAMTGVNWLSMSSARKNIQSRIDMLKLKPAIRRSAKGKNLVYRYKLSKAVTPLILVPILGELLFLVVTIGRFSSKKAVEAAYEKALDKIDSDNLSDSLAKLGNSNLSLYNKAKKEAGYLSVAGHSEIARQSLLALNTLLIDANLAGIDLHSATSIQTAVYDTSELVSSLVKEEQTGIHSNIDTYLNVVDSIKKDIEGKKSVFMELDGPEKEI